jgi:hypothetical protein
MSNGGGLHAAVREQRGTAVPDRGEEPHEIDITTPSVARMYDYYLGGKDHYRADQEAVRALLKAAPEARDSAVANRVFLRRAVRFLVREAGIRQLTGMGTTGIVLGDLREPEAILDHPPTRALIGFGEPVGLLLVAIFHFITEAENPTRILGVL